MHLGVSSLPSTELDLVALATGFALLHLPKMPELRGRDTSAFTPYPVDPASIPYKNRSRQKLQSMQRSKAGMGVLLGR